MSQIAWWTLDGHLKDSIQNNNMVATGNGVTIDNVGKIGKCYKTTRVREYLKSTNKYRLMGSQSYCCWFKIMTDNDDWGGLISTFNLTSKTGISIVTHKVDGGFNINVTAGFGNDYSNTICSSGGVLKFNTWYHIAMVFDYGNKSFKLFLNGELYARSSNITNSIHFSDSTNICIMAWDDFKRYFSSMYMNDVRIFDHALSLKEIREIAKAKILHIDFSQEINNSNIIVNTNKIVTNWLQSGVSLELMDNMVTPDGGKVYKLKKTGSSPALLRDSGNNYSSDVDSPLTYNKYYTFYLWCKKGDTDGHISIDISDSFNGGVTLTDEWKLVKASGICTSGYSFTDIYIPFTDGQFCYISQPQTTEGTNTLKIIDPINNSRDTKLPYNGKIIDKSGFGNDFSLQDYGPSKWVNESGKGMGSMFFDNGAKTAYRKSGVGEYIKSINKVYVPEQFTLSYWCKAIPDLSYNSYRRQNIYSTGWEQMCSCEGGAGSSSINQKRCGLIYKNLGGTSENYFTSYNDILKIHDGNWHNISIVIDCVNRIGKIFYDGVKIKESTDLPQFSWHNTYRYFVIGSAWNIAYGPWFGNLADVRVYATYLSDEDCIALYNQKASLSKNGSLFTSNLNESKYLSSNRLDYSAWKLGTTGNQTKPQLDLCVSTGFGQITNDDLNEIVIRKNPKNEDDIVWRGVRKDNNSETNGDGGFNTWTFRIDKNKIYRCSIWIKRPYLKNSTGNWYMGAYAYDENGSIPFITNKGNHADPNYYHYSSAKVYNNDWFLVVGYILPNNTSDSIFNDNSSYLTKIYNSSGKVLDTYDYKCKFPNNCVKMAFRSYLYYSNIQETEQYFYRPRVDVVDGTEPTVKQLINLEECDNMYKLNMNGINKESVFAEEEFSEVGNLDLVSAYYPLIEDFKDYSGNKLHLKTASERNTQTVVPSFTGNGVKFEKFGKYLAYNSDSALLDLSDTFTIAFNIKLNGEIADTHEGSRTTLFEKDLYNKDFSINLNQSSRQLQIQLYVGHANPDNPYVYAQVELGNIDDFINNFFNIIIIKTRTSLTVYVNGRKLSATVSQLTPVHGTGPLKIASGYCNTTGCIMNHIKIFKRPITEKEALTEYKWYSNQAKMLINSKNKMFTTQLIED